MADTDPAFPSSTSAATAGITKGHLKDAVDIAEKADQSDLAQEILDRENADSSLNAAKAVTNALTQEIGNRKAGFSALQQQLVENESQQRFHDSTRAFQYQHLEGLIQTLYAILKKPVPPSITHQPAIGRDVNIPIPNN